MQMSCRPLLSAFLLVAFSLTACNLAAERSDKHGAHAITDSDNDKITFVVGSPLVPSPDIEKAQKLYEQAKELQDHDSNTAKPVELLQKAIALNGAPRDFWIQLGDACRTDGKWRKGRCAYRMLLQRDALDANALVKVAEASLELQELDEAQKDALLSLSIRTDQESAWTALTDTLHATGRDDLIEAIDNLAGEKSGFKGSQLIGRIVEQMLSQAPQDKRLLQCELLYQMRCYKYDTAMVTANKLLALYPDDAIGIIGKAQILIAQDQAQAAIDILTPITTDANKQPVAWAVLGDAYAKEPRNQANLDKAIAAYENATRMRTVDYEWMEILKRLNEAKAKKI